MRRWGLVLGLMGLLVCPGCWAEETGSPAVPVKAAEPYTDREFDLWVLELRRAEIIALGSFPLAYLFANLGFDYYYYLANGYPSDNIPWPVGPGTSRWLSTTNGTDLERKNLILIGTSLAVGIGIAALDWWLGR